MDWAVYLIASFALIAQEPRGTVTVNGQETGSAIRNDPSSELPLDAFERQAEPIRPFKHIVRQINELPAPGDALPIPPSSRIGDGRAYGYDGKPFTFDYILMGRANVNDPATNVKVSQVDFDYRLTRPFFQTPWMFTFRPAAEIVFFSGPGGPAPILPAQVYKIAFDMQLDVPIGDVWGLSVGITPGLWTDFIVVDGNDFRLPARALITYRASDNLFFAGGLIYTDNIRRNLLPGIGVIWNPTDRWQFELLYPRSRVVYQINDDFNAYFVFERGGTTWNIRTLGQDEDFEFRDLRAMLGLEISRWPGFDLFVEMGMVFDRRMRFDIQSDVNVGEAFFLRVGTRF